MTLPAELSGEIVSFVQSVVGAMGLDLRAESNVDDEGLKINLQGEDGGVLIRRSGEGLQALQHLLATAFRRQLGDDYRVVVDCMGFRQEKDAELKQMARFTAEKALTTGAAQELGPLNPYERRLVHLTVAEIQGVSSESIGDAFLKTVIISARS
ncbi:MAG: protein jag [Vicinamibacterales bacterium]